MTYTFDGQNNISTKDISHPASYTYSFVQDEENYSIGNINTHRFTYAYDANNRLLTERETLTGTSDNYSGAVEVVKSYTYDANGNMLSKKSGGQIDDEVVKYTYDVWDRLSQFEDADGNIYQYAYNGNNERVSKITDGETTKFYWDRGYISNESTDGVLSTSNAIGVQGIFARTKDNNEEYLLKDGHGSVTDILSNGTVTDEFEYDAYGNQKTNTANDNPFRYCGEYQDLCSGLIYLRNRYYDPSIGRFITEDPAKDGFNWYVYCGNNPINYMDPMGLKQVGLRNYIESRGGSVSPVQKKFLFFNYGLSHINVTLNGKTVKYTSANYIIKNDRSYIDDGVLFDDFAVLSHSKNLESFIKSYESCSLSVYDAQPGKGDWTIGWGHKTTSNASSISQAQADSMFKDDLNKMLNTTFIPFLRENNIILSQNQFDAMVSFTYNFGEYSWGPNGYETMQTFLKQGDYSEVATREAFATYMGKRQPNGLIARRNDEIDMFLNGDYKRNSNYTRP